MIYNEFIEFIKKDKLAKLTQIDLLPISLAASHLKHLHNLITQVVDHLHGNAPLLRLIERA